MDSGEYASLMLHVPRHQAPWAPYQVYQIYHVLEDIYVYYIVIILNYCRLLTVNECLS